MSTYKPQKVALIALAVALVIAWAIVINIAIVISETMLQTLELIVELAAISP